MWVEHRAGFSSCRPVRSLPSSSHPDAVPDSPGEGGAREEPRKTRLNLVERWRRLQRGLLWGECSHTVSTCPICPSQPACFQPPRPGPVSSARSLFTINLSSHPNTITTPVLIDSCANANLISYELVQELKCPIQPLPVPHSTMVLDGRPLSRITHCTSPVSARFPDSHTELTSFFFCFTPSCTRWCWISPGLRHTILTLTGGELEF